MKQVVVVGGGITGLAAAYRLQAAAAPLRLTLIEQDRRLGGKILSEQVGGFLIEGGADSFLSRKPRGVGLCAELGLAERLVGRLPRDNKTYVRRHRQLYPLPEGLTGLVPTNLAALTFSDLLSPDGKARLAEELTLTAETDNGDESIASFISRRLGREAYQHLVEPLLSGIYAGDGEQLSLAATFPHLRQLERQHGSVIKGLLAGQQTLADQPDGWAPADYPPFVAFPTGMVELVAALAARLTGASLLTGVSVTAVYRTSTGYAVALSNGQTWPAEALVLTTPAFVTARLLADLDPTLAQAHAAIPYASVATISLAYAASDVPRPLDGYGYVIPRLDGTDVLACTWTSSKWAGRSPEGFALIRLYAGRYGLADVCQTSDAQLLDLAQAELRQTLGITAPPHLARLYRWPQGMPQYNLGHLSRLARVAARLGQHPGLFLAGAAYRGVGLPDCIQSGEEAAQNALNYLFG
ncbi:MAG: protoporphyrinogen oxidase [Candidatus Promineifilaceae bacterium]